MTKRIVAVALMALASIALALPATAADQTIDASITSTLAMTSDPTAAISGWTLASTGANTQAGGSIGINANGPYTVTVVGDKTRMTEYITASSAYETTSPKTLTSAVSVSASRTGGTAVTGGVGATAVVGTSSLLATGTGLGTDSYDVSLSQPTVISDSALPAGRTYHIVLTYTASSTL